MKKLKGSILAYSLIVVAIMVSIATALAGIAIIEKKTASSTEFSIQSIQTADSGIQIAVKAINSNLTQTIDSVFSSGNGFSSCIDGVVKGNSIQDTPNAGLYDLYFYTDANGENVIDSCSVPVSTVLSVKSVGAYKSTVRAVSVEVAAMTASSSEIKIGRNADLMILIDSSYSISDAQLEISKGETISLIERLGSDNRAGVVDFHGTSDLFSLSSYSNFDHVIDFVGDIDGGNHTNTGSAIAAARAELIGPNGRRSTSNPQVILIITDGAPNPEYGPYDYDVNCNGDYWNLGGASEARQASMEAKSDGIRMFVVAIGLDSYDGECLDLAEQIMLDIASSPEMNFSIDSFGQLGAIIDSLY